MFYSRNTWPFSAPRIDDGLVSSFPEFTAGKNRRGEYNRGVKEGVGLAKTGDRFFLQFQFSAPKFFVVEESELVLP